MTQLECGRVCEIAESRSLKTVRGCDMYGGAEGSEERDDRYCMGKRVGEKANMLLLFLQNAALSCHKREWWNPLKYIQPHRFPQSPSPPLSSNSANQLRHLNRLLSSCPIKHHHLFSQGEGDLKMRRKVAISFWENFSLSKRIFRSVLMKAGLLGPN